MKFIHVWLCCACLALPGIGMAAGGDPGRGNAADAADGRGAAATSSTRSSACSTARARSRRSRPPRRPRPPASATAGKDGFSLQVGRRRLPAQAARLHPASTAASTSTTRSGRPPTPSCCAASARSSRARSSRSSTSASCPTSPRAAPSSRTATSTPASHPAFKVRGRQVQAPGRPGAAAVGDRHPVRRARLPDRPGAQPRPRHPAARRPRRRRRQLRRRACSTACPTAAAATSTTSDDKDLAARLFFTPFAKGTGGLRGLGFGVAATQGSQEGHADGARPAGYRTPGQQTFFSYRTDGTAAGTVIADGDRVRLSPQGYFYRGPFGLLAEYVHLRPGRAARRGGRGAREHRLAVPRLLGADRRRRLLPGGQPEEELRPGGQDLGRVRARGPRQPAGDRRGRLPALRQPGERRRRRPTPGPWASTGT